MQTIALILGLYASFSVVALGQMCQQGSAIVRLVNLDSCRNVDAIVECASKMQITTTPMCSVQLQPDLKVSQDGTFCETDKGILQRGGAVGKWSMGKSDISFEVKSLNNPAYATMLLMSLKGRVVPEQGGTETPVDCNLLLNVTAGTALGVVSMGQDSLMSTTYAGPATTTATTEAGLSQNGGYSNGMGTMQQQGQVGTQTGSSADQQSGTTSTFAVQTGRTAPTDPYTAATSSASRAAAAVLGWLASMLGTLLLVLQ